jgi:16S rRNA (guanine1207-N2)-methyltransferase
MEHNPTAPYNQLQRFKVILGQEQLDMVTKPGLSAWKVVFPSLQLFISTASFSPGDRVLLLGCHLGVLAAFLARVHPGLSLFLTDHSYNSLEMARLTLAANYINGVTILNTTELSEDLFEAFNLVYLQLPKGRSLARRWMVQAYHTLKVDGSLYLGGANDAGIQSSIKDARSLFTRGEVLAYKKGSRVARFLKSPGDALAPDWYNAPGISPGSWVEFTIELNHRTFRIRSLPGVFSYNRLDEATRMLLQSVAILPDAKVLDVGCGYGVLGLYAAAQGASLVHLVDDNFLAVASSQATLKLNRVANAQVYTGDLLTPLGNNQYDLILSNPPFHAGHSVNYQITQALIEQSYQALNPGGRLVIVVSSFLRYDHLIQSIFNNVTVLAESGKFRLLSGLKSRGDEKG